MERKSKFWNIYFIILTLAIILGAIWAVKNINYIKYSPCEACNKMGYSCNKLSLNDKQITPEYAWREVIKESKNG